MLENLDRELGFVLIRETDEATGLVAAAVGSIGGMSSAYHDHAAVLALLSIGMEKLLKLTIGIAALDDGAAWPSQRTMRGYRHDVTELNREVVGLYRDRLEQSTAPGYMQQLLAGAEVNEIAAGVLEAATRWGAEGRFDRLDELAGQPRRAGASTEELWDEVEQNVLRRRPDLMAEIAEPRTHEHGLRIMNAHIGEGIAAWWELHRRAWMTGLIGANGQSLGPGLALQLRP